MLFGKKLVDKSFCQWLCHESETKSNLLYGGWKSDRQRLYPTYDISIDDLDECCVRLILLTFQNNIGNVLYNRFNIDKNHYKLDIVDCFIVKYNAETQTSLEEHSDDSDLTVIIGLSDKNDFNGGGTEFQNGLRLNYDQGDAIIFGSKYNHKGVNITDGTRMIITFFINVILNN